MKLLLDENISPLISKMLKRKRFEVKSVAEDYQAYANGNLLISAAKEKRIFIAKDKDFGELVFKLNYPHSGVILLRLKDDSNKNTSLVLNKVLRYSKEVLVKSFTVVTENDIRITAAPF